MPQRRIRGSFRELQRRHLDVVEPAVVVARILRLPLVPNFPREYFDI